MKRPEIHLSQVWTPDRAGFKKDLIELNHGFPGWRGYETMGFESVKSVFYPWLKSPAFGPFVKKTYLTLVYLTVVLASKIKGFVLEKKNFREDVQKTPPLLNTAT